jgi:hypothetical protein
MTIEPELRKEICCVGRSLFEGGYVHATAGNVSRSFAEWLSDYTIRCLPGISQTGAAGACSALDSVQQSGERGSKMLALHHGIYAADDSAACIIPDQIEELRIHFKSSC